MLEVSPYAPTTSLAPSSLRATDQPNMLQTAGPVLADPRGATSHAVGAAVGRNPISVIVPCHRVAGADGSLLSTMNVEADYVVKRNASRGAETMDGAALVQSITTRYARQYFTVGQSFVVDFQGQNLLLKVGPCEALVIDKAPGSASDGGAVQRGMLTAQTQLQLARAQGSPIVFTGLESQTKKTIFKQVREPSGDDPGVI